MNGIINKVWERFSMERKFDSAALDWTIFGLSIGIAIGYLFGWFFYS